MLLDFIDELPRRLLARIVGTLEKHEGRQLEFLSKTKFVMRRRNVAVKLAVIVENDQNYI